MAEKEYTTEETERLNALLLQAGGEVQEVIHRALAFSDADIQQTAELIREHDLNDRDRQRTAELDLQINSRTDTHALRRASWIFACATRGEIFTLDLDQTEQWGRQRVFFSISVMRLTGETTAHVFDDRVLIATRNIAAGDVNLREQHKGMTFTAYFSPRGNWTTSQNNFYYLGRDLESATHFSFSYPQQGDRNHIAADDERRLLFYTTGNRLWRVPVQRSGPDAVPASLGTPALVKTFPTVRNFRSMAYSEATGMMYLCPDDGRNLYAFHPFGGSSLRIGGRTQRVSIEAPLRPYHDFTIQCLIHLNSMAPGATASIFGGDYVPTLQLRTHDMALIFRWFTHDEPGIPLYEAVFPRAMEHCVGNWVTLSITLRDQQLTLFCNGKRFSAQLPGQCPAFWDVSRWNFFIGSRPATGAGDERSRSADFNISELRFWDRALKDTIASQPISSWLVNDRDGFPEGLHRYFRLDAAAAAVFDPVAEKFEYHKSVDLVSRSERVQGFAEAEQGSNAPGFYNELIHLSSSLQGPAVSNISVCDISQRIFWIAEPNPLRTVLCSASALGAEPVEQLADMYGQLRVLSALWAGFTHVQYLDHAYRKRRLDVQTGNDLLHAARMQTHLELQWMNEKNKNRRDAAARFRATDNTISEHREAHKRFLRLQDERHKSLQQERARDAARIRQAREEEHQRMRNAQAEKFRRKK